MGEFKWYDIIESNLCLSIWLKMTEFFIFEWKICIFLFPKCTKNCLSDCILTLNILKIRNLKKSILLFVRRRQWNTSNYFNSLHIHKKIDHFNYIVLWISCYFKNKQLFFEFFRSWWYALTSYSVIFNTSTKINKVTVDTKWLVKFKS